jgi:hypothetical protein
MLDVGWHVGSPSQRKHGKLQPELTYRVATNAHHQLFRTYEERPYNLRVCGIPVTWGLLRISAMRSLGAYHNAFSIGSFIDQLAVAAGADPSNSS